MAGGAVVVEDAAMTPDAVRAIVLPLLLDAERRGRMAAAARAEGCIGSQGPAAAVALFLGVLAFLRFWKRLG